MPTAEQSVSVAHEIPRISPKRFVPANLLQVPFWSPARNELPPVLPTAQQPDAVGHETDPNMPDRTGLLTTCVPDFPMWTISGVCSLGVTTVHPTPQQSPGLAQLTLRRTPLDALGTRSAVHLLPFQSSTSAS